MLDSMKKTIGYYYFRFLLVTELYMVEPWERLLMFAAVQVGINVLVFIAVVYLSILTMFNNRVLVQLISLFFNPPKMEDLWHPDLPLTLMGKV